MFPFRDRLHFPLGEEVPRVLERWERRGVRER
jgi:hypothetical protein